MIMTNFNEWTNTLLYKNITLTLYSREGDVSCVWEVSGDRRTDCYIDPKFFFEHSSTFSSSWLGCSTVGYWGPKALCLPLALTSASCLQLIQVVCVLVILLFNVHLLPLFFCLFTQVHLLIDGSVEGQYVTVGASPFWGLSRLEESLFWSSIRVYLFLLSIDSF